MKVLFIFAHPDDESFSSGGTIAKLTKKGHSVHLICATRGEKGSVGDPPICLPEELGTVREKEHGKALKTLGVTRVTYLDLVDGTLKSVGKTKLKKILCPLVTNENPDVIVTFDKHGGSNHPDHKTISKAVTELFYALKQTLRKKVSLYHTTTPKSYLRVYEKAGISYTAFGVVVGTRDTHITTVVDISETFAIKEKALHFHKTQHKDVERFMKRKQIVDLKKEYFVLISENTIC